MGAYPRVTSGRSPRPGVTAKANWLFVEASEFARHPGRSHRSAFWLVLARAVMLGSGGSPTPFARVLNPMLLATILHPNSILGSRDFCIHTYLGSLPARRVDMLGHVIN
jgi:hypothetical protein